MAGAKAFFHVCLLALLAAAATSSAFAQQSVLIRNNEYDAGKWPLQIHCRARYANNAVTGEFGPINLGYTFNHTFPVPHASTKILCDFFAPLHGGRYAQKVVVWENGDPYWAPRMTLPCSITPLCAWMVDDTGFSVEDPNTGFFNLVVPWAPPV